MADDLIDGLCCSWCGIYFEESHGYPVLCDDCWNDPDCTEEDKENLQRSLYSEL